MTEKVNFENAEELPGLLPLTKKKRAIPSENAFTSTAARAEHKGMKVNTLKTNILCVSDALAYTPLAYIKPGDMELCSKPNDRLKVLGFVMGDRPSVRPHVESIIKKFRQQFWTLYNLKKNGFSSEELVIVYKTMILPLADYCDVVYHPLLTDELDEELDWMQNHALRCIFGPSGGRKLRQLAGVTTLRQRRIEHCDAFAAKCLKNGRFAGWFPLKQGRRSTRGDGAREKYLETFARCERLRASPLHFFRRRLNGKQGKEYGKRYREYRED